MRKGKAFVVGLGFALTAVASAVGGLTPSFTPAPKISEHCNPLRCRSIEQIPSLVIPRRPPVLVCYCGSKSPILIQIISDLNQISSADSEKYLVKLNSSSTLGGMTAQYMLVDNAEFANLLNNEKFSYTVLQSKGRISIKLSDFVFP